MAVAIKPATSSRGSSKKSTRTRTKGFAVIRWIETHCVHTKAEWIGKPFRLLDWQKEWILRLFVVDESDLRIKRWALLGVAKKNGKSELAAALALYFLIGDGEPAPLVIVAAASEEQAGLVFTAAATMCKMSPTLSQITECYDKEIRVPSIPGAQLKRVAAAIGTNDGANIHAVVIDELHEWQGNKGKQVWDVLTNGGPSRRQPMILQITTAGYDLEGTICGRQYTYGKQVQEGVVKDDRYLFHWIEAPADCDYTDPAVWEAANPSWGKTIPSPMAYYGDLITKKTESVFRRYFLNQWVQTEEIWEVAQLWDALQSPLELDRSLPIMAGVDIGLRHDTTAVVVAQRIEERIVLRARVWENPEPQGSRQHDEWELDLDAVENYIRDLYRDFPAAARERIHGPAVYYDPFFFVRSAQVLESERINMVEYPQRPERMVAASQGFFELVKSGIIAHNGDETLRRHIRNVTAEQQPRGWRITKPKGSTKHIDAAIASAIAAFECSRVEPALPTPGIRIIEAGE